MNSYNLPAQRQSDGSWIVPHAADTYWMERREIPGRVRWSLWKNDERLDNFGSKREALREANRLIWEAQHPAEKIPAVGPSIHEGGRQWFVYWYERGDGETLFRRRRGFGSEGEAQQFIDERLVVGPEPAQDSTLYRPDAAVQAWFDRFK